jgi:hypothetical protein
VRPGVLSVAWIGLLLAAGCATPQRQAGVTPATQLAPTTFPSEETDLTPATTQPSLRALSRAPLNWTAKPLIDDKRQSHTVWISPSGDTAYGIIRVGLPLPAPHEPVLWVFLSEMRKREGEATLLAKQWDDAVRGLRFEAEGVKYLLRATLSVRGMTCWVVYAGTHRDKPINEEELQQAIRARELTRIGQ